MKTISLFAAVAALGLFPSCNITLGKTNSDIKYVQLPPTGKNMPIQSFTSIKANGVFNLYLIHGATESVVVKNNYPEDLKITNDGNTLVIIDTLSNHDGLDTMKTNIYVTYKQLNSIETESVGKIRTLDTIKCPKFTFESDGVGENILWINADSVFVSENGVAAVVLAGKAHNATIDDDGVGAVKARNFIVDTLHLMVNGVGAANVYATRKIYLHANGIGSITYYGPAKVIVKEQDGIGKIEHGE
jgi:hypothetical protein